jgi:hypothetical protein
MVFSITPFFHSPFLLYKNHPEMDDERGGYVYGRSLGLDGGQSI